MLNSRKIVLVSSLVLVMLTLLVLSGCSSSLPENSGDAFTISDEGSFSADVCAAKGLTGKAIMLESRYCPHCTATLPDFNQACSEAGVDCEVLDLADEENINKMYSYGIAAQFTPTFIIDCEYFVGAKTFEEYFDLLIPLNNK